MVHRLAGLRPALTAFWSLHLRGDATRLATYFSLHINPADICTGRPIPKIDPSRICVFMAFDTRYAIGELAEAINRRYCELHGYSFRCDRLSSQTQNERHVSWQRLLQALKYLRLFDYVVWIDGDAAFMARHGRLEELIDLLPDRDLFLTTHPGGDLDLVNAGVIVFRRSTATTQFIESLIAATKQSHLAPFKKQFPWEQACLAYSLYFQQPVRPCILSSAFNCPALEVLALSGHARVPWQTFNPDPMRFHQELTSACIENWNSSRPRFLILHLYALSGPGRLALMRTVATALRAATHQEPTQRTHPESRRLS